MRAIGSGGTALPGLIVEGLDPNAATTLARDLSQTTLITGTNGKTTSAAMLARILRADDRRVIHNHAGSNLLRGVTATLIESATSLGSLPDDCSAVFEADEAALPEIAQVAPPDVVVFTNLMRDQLDRYGEIESIALRWIAALPSLPAEATLVVNVDDPLVAAIAEHWSGRCLRYGIEDPDVPPAPEGEIMDAIWDPQTNADFRYERRYFAQLGRWYTDQGKRRPTPEIAATRINLGLMSDSLFLSDGGTQDEVATLRALAEAGGGASPNPGSASNGTRFQTSWNDSVANAQDSSDVGTCFQLVLPEGDLEIALPAEGLYSVYNALAAASAAVAMGIAPDAIAQGLTSHEAAFGRQETLEVEGRRVRILLGKNPSGLNQALRTLQRPGAQHHLLVLLNDGIADGTDVSWIWDADWESQAPHCASLTVGGRRAADIALRIEYAGFPQPASPQQPEIGAALRQALDSVPVGEELVILPTYTAMLDVRRQLGRLGASSLWEVA